MPLKAARMRKEKNKREKLIVRGKLEKR